MRFSFDFPLSECCRLPMTAHRWSIMCLFLLVCITSASDPPTDRGILEIFYFACNGDYWTDNTNWINPEASICNWTGVECKADSEETVEMIRLPNNNITCLLPKELLLLPSLSWLDLRTNFDLNADFRLLQNHVVAPLEYLVLSDTNAGSLDGIEFFSDSLTTLYMGGCELSGSFPENVLSLSSLRHLDLSFNFLSGTISDNINQLQDLRTLGLSHNFFNGQIPPSIGSLNRLSNVQMQFNALSGTLPAEMNDLYSLTFLTLNNQDITGPLLDFATLQFLFHVDFSFNQLSGDIPQNLLDSLLAGFGYSTVLDLRSNRLRGTVPLSLVRLENILAYFADNEIESVPSELCQEAESWLFGQVSQFGCNALLCPPGTFNPFGRQVSDGFPCWTCRTGEVAPYYGSQKCHIADNSTSLEFGDTTQDVISLVHVNSPLERLSNNNHDEESAVPILQDDEHGGPFWRNGLDEETTDVADIGFVVSDSASKGVPYAAFGMLATLATVSTMLILLL